MQRGKNNCFFFNILALFSGEIYHIPMHALYVATLTCVGAQKGVLIE